ncbi:hypothetical protein K438DRAFT_1768916 [Mycena galopus ATCC 62051]|nr:hypothetical protein K438DRAFT_1768916 [Mycena galopus ATCC 62051]
MPEARASEASFQLASGALIHLLNSRASMRVKHVEIDASEKEANLGPLFLMIQWLTHTSAHFYPRPEWDTTIKLTDKKVRKNCGGMALVSKDHVLAFLSIDLVFRVQYPISIPSILSLTMTQLATALCPREPHPETSVRWECWGLNGREPWATSLTTLSRNS